VTIGGSLDIRISYRVRTWRLLILIGSGFRRLDISETKPVNQPVERISQSVRHQCYDSLILIGANQAVACWLTKTVKDNARTPEKGSSGP